MNFLFWPFKRARQSTLDSMAPATVAANSKTKRRHKYTARRRRAAAVLGSVLACLMTPLTIVQSKLYRSDLAMARQHFPGAPNFSSRDRVLVLSPHCDDETLGAGGTIAQARRAGAQIKVLFFTNGDGSRSTQIAENAKHLRRFSFQELAAMRQRESLAAVAELGVAREDVIFLGYPDGGLRAMWESHWTRTNYRSPYTNAMRSPYPNSFTRAAPYRGSQVLADVEKVMGEFKPTAVLCTHPADTHGDHWAAYAYTRAALEKLRLRLCDAPDNWPQRTQLLTFLVHHGVWPVPHGYHPSARLAPPAKMRDCGTQWIDAALDGTAQTQKKAALERYVSQLIFTPHYLRAFLRRNEIFGTVPPKVLSSHGEATLLRDERDDSMWHKVWPGADIRALWLRPGAQGWNLRLQTAGRPSSRFHYEVSIHALAAGTTQAMTCKVLWRDGNWVARLSQASKEDEELRLRMLPDGFEIDIPSQVRGAVQTSAGTFLMSAAVLRGNSRIDQTETATWRLDGD